MNLSLQEQIEQLPTHELQLLKKEIDRIQGRRRMDYLLRIAQEQPTKLPKEEVDRLADSGRSAFSLPIADWAAVRIRMHEISREDAEKHCIRFMPIVDVINSEQTDEYRDLFRKEALL